VKKGTKFNIVIACGYKFIKTSCSTSLDNIKATSWKVVGSIADKAFEIFQWLNPSSCTMALGMAQPLTETSTRDLLLGGGGGVLTTLVPSRSQSTV
jgi:hypothetical protein